MTVTPNPAGVTVGGNVQMRALARDAGGHALSGVAFTWSTSNANATVNGSGLVHGVQAGPSVVTADASGVKGTANLTVNPSGPPGTLQVLRSEFMGGSDEDLLRDVAVDAQGNIIIVGNTRSPNWTGTPGSYDPTFNTGGAVPGDAIVMKFNPAGALLWSTLVGGPNFERAYGVEVDPSGNIIIAGRAGGGLPATAGTFDPTFNPGVVNAAYGTQNGFVCKLNSAGTTLFWCSYFGTDDGEIIRDVAVDGSGDIYIAAANTNPGLPTSWFANAYQPTHAAGRDCVVAKIKGDGTQVLWATYLGGSGNETGGPSLRVDAQKNVYLACASDSPDLPVTAGGRQFKASSDMYIAKFSPDGHNLLYGTYIGGSGIEDSETHTLELNPQGEVYAAFTTHSSDFPTTAGSLQPQFSGPTEMGIVHLSTTGALLQATYYGGTGGEGAEGVQLDGQGNVWISGYSNSPTGQLPQTLTVGVLGLADLVVLKLDPTLSQKLWSLRLGGSLLEFGRTIAVDSSQNVWIAGQTSSSDFPRINSAQTNYAGGTNDAAIWEIGP